MGRENTEKWSGSFVKTEFICMCMDVLPARMSGHHMHACCLRRLE